MPEEEEMKDLSLFHSDYLWRQLGNSTRKVFRNDGYNPNSKWTSLVARQYAIHSYVFFMSFQSKILIYFAFSLQSRVEKSNFIVQTKNREFDKKSYV